MASEPKQPTASSPPAELSQLKPEQIAALAAATTVIQGPVANAASSVIMQAVNDAVIIFGRPRPLIGPDGSFANIATMETTAIIHMSMAALKDLHWALGENISIYEKSHGEIITDAMKQRAAAEKK